MKLNNVIKAQQFDKATVERVFAITEEMKRGHFDPKILEGRTMITLFYEPSTRTRLSFELAMFKLGGRVTGTENALEFSSAAKGESVEDTFKVLSGYGPDVIVLRYHKQGGAERAQNVSSIPIINAGDGNGQHPTQALLDLFTIKEAFGQIEKLKIAMVGDLANGRTVRSLCYFLAKHYSDNEIFFVSPEPTRMKDDVKEYLARNHVKFCETAELAQVLPTAHVIYQTRVQAERFKESSPELLEAVVKASQNLTITPEALNVMRSDAIIMHPLPRVTEISPAVDQDPRAAYFNQAKNGLYIRMALLKMVLIGY